MAVDRDRTRTDRKTPRDQVEQRGLARPVGADDGVALAAGYREIDAPDDLGPSEILAHVAQFDRRRAHDIASGRLALSISASQRRRKPRASRRSQRPPSSSAAMATSHGRGAMVSMVGPPIANVLPWAAPMVSKDASSTTRTKPS